MLVPTDSLDSIYERSAGVFSTTQIRDLPPKTVNHFHTLKTLKIEINVKLIECPSAPTGDWFPDPVDAKVPYTYGGHCTQLMQSLKHLRYDVSAVLLHSIAQGTRTRTKLCICSTVILRFAIKSWVNPQMWNPATKAFCPCFYMLS